MPSTRTLRHDWPRSPTFFVPNDENRDARDDRCGTIFLASLTKGLENQLVRTLGTLGTQNPVMRYTRR